MVTKGGVFFISLGCARNLVDSEHMLGIVRSRGFALASRIEDAEIVVINTCGFIQSAVREAIDTIFEVTLLKKQGKLEKVVVVGCLVQRYGYRLLREIPEVDGWLGTGEIQRIADLLEIDGTVLPAPFFIGRPLYLADHSVPRVQSTPFYSSYLKIAEGCSHRCSYCIISSLRGPFRSRTPQSLIEEAEDMIAKGVKEINLIAQDTTMYGKDLEGDICLEGLLENLVELKGIIWIRLLYSHPSRISDRLLEIIESEEVICPYIDMPQQHVNEKILRAMGRTRHEESPLELIERIRSKRRKICLRTTLMVGFPGETEEMFEEVCNFVEVARFDHLGVFVFSPEEGTQAARLKPAVPHSVGQQRRDKIMEIQGRISMEKNQEMLGRVVPVLIEGPSAETDLLLTGRIATMAPEVDGQVLINKGVGLAGEIMPVVITEAHSYDLVGEIRV